jgi:hypothetical protein
MQVEYVDIRDAYADPSKKEYKSEYDVSESNDK